MLARLKKLRNPPVFQGRLTDRRYFEGWYFKLVDRQERHKLALIPGISLDADQSQSHAFVQLIDGVTAKTSYFEYPLEAFDASDKELDVRIGDSRFRADRVELHLGEGDERVDGDLRFEGIVPWPVTLRAPGVMGWYAYVPFMECYHGLVSLDHVVDGRLQFGGVDVSFSGGRGYTEKDWGTSFPSAYLWMQSNHFSEPGTSIMASVARIPWLGRHFTGFIITLWHDGARKLFATYTGARLESLEIEERRVALKISDRQHLLEVEASRQGDETAKDDGFGLLRSPRQGSMQGRIAETLTAEISIRLHERRRWGRGSSLSFEGLGRNAGLEIEATTSDLEIG